MPLYNVHLMGRTGQQKYYPVASLIGQTSVKELAEIIEKSSTVAEADIYAVLKALGPAMKQLMNASYSVQLPGIGSFRPTADVKRGAGKDTEAAVTAADIVKTNIRFIPETSWNQAHTVMTRALTDGMTWSKRDVKAGTTQATTPAGGQTQQGETGGETGGSAIDPFGD